MPAFVNLFKNLVAGPHGTMTGTIPSPTGPIKMVYYTSDKPAKPEVQARADLILLLAKVMLAKDGYQLIDEPLLYVIPTRAGHHRMTVRGYVFREDRRTNTLFQYERSINMRTPPETAAKRVVEEILRRHLDHLRDIERVETGQR